MLSLMEGAFIFTRARRSTESLRVAGATAVEAVSQALRDADGEDLQGDLDGRRGAE